MTNVVTSEGDDAYPKRRRLPRHAARHRHRPDHQRALRAGRRRAPAAHRPHPRREVQQDRHPDRRRENDSAPLSPSGTIDWGVITASQIIGRTQCINYQGTGNCALNNRHARAARAHHRPAVRPGRPARHGRLLRDRRELDDLAEPRARHGRAGPGTATNNANLTLGAGVRYIGAKMNDYTTATGKVNYSHISHQQHHRQRLRRDERRPRRHDGATGNVNASPTTSARQPADRREQLVGPVRHRRPPTPARRSRRRPTRTPGRTRSTAPPTVETVDAAATTSNAVDFFPYRNGSQATRTRASSRSYRADPGQRRAADGRRWTRRRPRPPGDDVTLTATPADDFGVKRVRFTDGATTLGTVDAPPYTQTSRSRRTPPATRTRTLHRDRHRLGRPDGFGQKTVTVSCAAPARRRPPADRTRRRPPTRRACRGRARSAAPVRLVRADRPGRPEVGRRVPRRPSGLHAHRRAVHLHGQRHRRRRRRPDAARRRHRRARLDGRGTAQHHRREVHADAEPEDHQEVAQGRQSADDLRQARAARPASPRRRAAAAP